MSRSVSKKHFVPCDKPRRLPMPDHHADHKLRINLNKTESGLKQWFDHSRSEKYFQRSTTENRSIERTSTIQRNDSSVSPLRLYTGPSHNITPQKGNLYVNDPTRCNTPETPFQNYVTNSPQSQSAFQNRKLQSQWNKGLANDTNLTSDHEQIGKSQDEYYLLLQQHTILKTEYHRLKMEISGGGPKTDYRIEALKQERQQLVERSQSLLTENKEYMVQCQQYQQTIKQLEQELQQISLQLTSKQEQLERLNDAYLKSAQKEQDYLQALQNQQQIHDDNEKSYNQQLQHLKNQVEMFMHQNEQNECNVEELVRAERNQIESQYKAIAEEIQRKSNEDKQKLQEALDSLLREKQKDQNQLQYMRLDLEQSHKKLMETQEYYKSEIRNIKSDFDKQTEWYQSQLEFHKEQFQTKLAMLDNMRKIQITEESDNNQRLITLEKSIDFKDISKSVSPTNYELEIKKLQDLINQYQEVNKELNHERDMQEQLIGDLQRELHDYKNKGGSQGSSQSSQRLKQIIQIQKQQIESHQKTILNQHYEIQTLQNALYASGDDYKNSQCSSTKSEASEALPAYQNALKSSNRLQLNLTHLKREGIKQIEDKENKNNIVTPQYALHKQQQEDTFRNTADE